MISVVETLPDDVEALQAMVVAMRAELDAEHAENVRVVEERDRLVVRMIVCATSSVSFSECSSASVPRSWIPISSNWRWRISSKLSPGRGRRGKGRADDQQDDDALQQGAAHQPRLTA